MRGSLIIDFDSLDGSGGDYVEVRINNEIRDRHYSSIDGLYSTYIYPNDVCNIRFTDASKNLIELIDVYRIDYTTDDENNDRGIKNIFISSTSGTTSGITVQVTFTATTRPDAYDFYYKIGNSYQSSWNYLFNYYVNSGTTDMVRSTQFKLNTYYDSPPVNFLTSDSIVTTGNTSGSTSGVSTIFIDPSQFSLIRETSATSNPLGFVILNSTGSVIYNGNNIKTFYYSTPQLITTGTTKVVTTIEPITGVTFELGDNLVFNWTDNLSPSYIAPACVTTNRVAYYDTTDVSSYPGTGTTWIDIQNNYDATIYGNPTYVTGVTNYFGTLNYFDFDGVDDYVELPTGVTLGNINVDMTISVWFRFSSSNNELVWQRGIGNVDSYNQGFSMRLVKTNTNKMQFTMRLQSALNTVQTTVLTSNMTVSPNVWYNVTIVKNSNFAVGDDTYMYINGSEQAYFYDPVGIPQSLVPSLSPSIPNWLVGKGQTNVSPLFGNIDIATFQLYNGAYSQEDVLNLYNCSRTKYGYYT